MVDGAWQVRVAARLRQLGSVAAVVVAGTASTAGRAGVGTAGQTWATAMASPAVGAPGAVRGAALAFRGVTVVDVARGRLLPDQTVVVMDRWIRAVGPARRTRVPAGAQVIDARDKYLIPGLWDMETYPDYGSHYIKAEGDLQPRFKLMIAYGVTGYRQLDPRRDGVTIDSMLEWRRKITAGTWVGPRILIGTPRLEGVDSTLMDTSRFNLATPAQARAMVDSLHAAGADHIFVYHTVRMERAVVFAMLAEARRLHMPVVGHLQQTVTLTEVSDSGMRAVDHLMGTQNVCINFTLQAPPYFNTDPDSAATLAKCTALARRLRRNHTWMALGPLWLMGAPSRLTNQVYRRRLQFIPRRIRPDTRDSVDAIAELNAMRDTLLSSNALAIAESSSDALAIADRADLPMLMATDGMISGYPLHDNLALAVEHGLRPVTALQAVTINAAAYLGATDTLGTVAPGKLADLVLLDGNPLQDIYNTQRIQAVVANGRYFSRAGLDSLLRQTASAP